MPEVYALPHRLVDLEGDVHVGGHIDSVPSQLIGRRVEVRETEDHVRVFAGPRQVAVHERVLTVEKRRVTVPEHRPPRGACAAHVRPCPPEEHELAGAEPVLAAYAAELKQRGTTRWTVALRRLWQMWRDDPRQPLLVAGQEAAHYGLYEVDRLEWMVLRQIAGDYCVRPARTSPPTTGSVMPRTAMEDDVAQLLQSLRLKKMAELVDAEMQHAEQQQLSDQDFLARLLRAQWQANEENALAWRIQRAGLPAHKLMEERYRQRPTIIDDASPRWQPERTAER